MVVGRERRVGREQTTTVPQDPSNGQKQNKQKQIRKANTKHTEYLQKHKEIESALTN